MFAGEQKREWGEGKHQGSKCEGKGDCSFLELSHSQRMPVVCLERGRQSKVCEAAPRMPRLAVQGELGPPGAPLPSSH